MDFAQEQSAYDDRHDRVPTADFSWNEFAEVCEIIQGWPVERRLELADFLGLPMPDEPAIREEAQRELLQRLFAGVRTGRELIERVSLAAFAAAWPDGCPVTSGDLAELCGMSERTAQRRARAARVAGTSPDKQRAKPVSVAGN